MPTFEELDYARVELRMLAACGRTSKPRNSGGFRFVGRQRFRTLRKRGEAVYYDYATGFYAWRTSWTEQDFKRIRAHGHDIMEAP